MYSKEWYKKWLCFVKFIFTSPNKILIFELSILDIVIDECDKFDVRQTIDGFRSVPDI